MTDKRWKAVERGMADKLNRTLSGIGNLTPIERIPLLGREGPDLTINETGLVINVKSRKAIPAHQFPSAGTLLHTGDLVIFQLRDICRLHRKQLLNTFLPATQRWKQLHDWHAFMDKWTRETCPTNISAILLHRPRMPYGAAGLAIQFNDLRRLQCQMQAIKIKSS